MSNTHNLLAKITPETTFAEWIGFLLLHFSDTDTDACELALPVEKHADGTVKPMMLAITVSLEERQ